MILYTQTICPKCTFAKSELARKGLEYETVNLDEQPEVREELLDAGCMATPVLKTDDGELLPSYEAILAFINK